MRCLSIQPLLASFLLLAGSRVHGQSILRGRGDSRFGQTEAEEPVTNEEEEASPSITSASAKALAKALDYLDQTQVKEDKPGLLFSDWVGDWPQWLELLPVPVFRGLRMREISPFFVTFIHHTLTLVREPYREVLQLNDDMIDLARDLRVRAAGFMKKFQGGPLYTDERTPLEEYGSFGFWPQDPNPYFPYPSEKIAEFIDANMYDGRMAGYGDRHAPNIPAYPNFIKICADSDDTAATIAALQDHEEFDGGNHVMDMSGGDENAVNYVDGEHAIDFATFFAEWRDTDDKRMVTDQSWHPVNSGAFVTWLNYQGSYHTQQDVDLVVNANVLFLLGKSGRKDTPGYKEAVGLINKAAAEGLHRVEDPPGTRPAETGSILEVSYYYGNNHAFQYMVSRAYARGNVIELKPAVDILVEDLKDIAIHDEETGLVHWDLGWDATIINTALAVLTLLNAADAADNDNSFIEGIDDLVQKGVAWLLEQQEEDGSWDEMKPFYFGAWPNLGIQWYSKPFTVAMAFEAVARAMMRASDIGRAGAA